MSSTRRHFLLGALTAPLLAEKKNKNAAPERPSVLLILHSGLASWMLGCYGNQEIHTPNIDRFAQTGMRFTNHFASTPDSPACAATLFTGFTPRQATGQPPMISDILAGQGYNCGYAGEWRLGNDAQARRGFPFWEIAAAPDQATDAAARFLDRQSAGKPFFLAVGYPAPQPSAAVPSKYLEMYAGVRFESIGFAPMAANAAHNREMFRDFLGNLRRTAAAITALDAHVATLVEKVRARRLLDTTLIVFTSETGALLGQHGLWGQSQASEPANMYEEVIQTPMIWSWLGRVPPTNTRPELIAAYDLLPTLCELTASPLPEGRKLPGRSYLPLAFDRKLPKKEPWRSLVFGGSGSTELARDTRYKLVLRDQGKSQSEFYDLATDAHERSSQYDNPQYVDMRDRLAGELSAWRRQP